MTPADAKQTVFAYHGAVLSDLRVDFGPWLAAGGDYAEGEAHVGGAFVDFPCSLFL
jgi:hypothetical protein